MNYLQNQNKMIKSIGWVGSVLLALCGLPLAIEAVANRGVSNLNLYFTFMWYIGEICVLIYVIKTHGFDRPLLFNYVLNIIFVSIVLFFYFF